MFRDYLFTQPSFLTGAARVFDLGGTYDRSSYLLGASPAEADVRALASDFRVTWRDLQRAVDEGSATHGQIESIKG